MMDRNPCPRCGLIYGHRYPCTEAYEAVQVAPTTIRCSHQTAGGRHLAPFTPAYPFRCIVNQLLPDGWCRTAVFEAADFETANQGSVELCEELIDAGALDVHYYIGRVAS